MSALPVSGNRVSAVGELISDSTIAPVEEWKSLDRSQNPTIQLSGPEYHALLRTCSGLYNFDRRKHLARVSGLNSAERVLEYLNDQAFQFNSRKRFRSDLRNLEHIQRRISDGLPVQVVIPAFCVIGNWAKRHEPTTLTFAEKTALEFLERIAAHCRELHGVVIEFLVISDATFYVKPLRSCPVLGVAYVEQLRHYCLKGKLSHVTILDMSEIVSPRAREFNDRFVKWRKLLSADPTMDLEAADAASWLDSVTTVISTSDYSATPSEERSVFGEGLRDTEYGRFITSRAEECFVDYRAMKNALADICWDEVAFPNSVRATIHQKPIPVLGLRLYPEYKKSSRLLPYHGIGIIEDLTEPVLTVRPEVTVCGDSDYQRLATDDGSSDLYVRSVGQSK